MHSNYVSFLYFFSSDMTRNGTCLKISLLKKNTIGLSLQYRWVAVMSASGEETGKHSEEELKQNTEDITQSIWNSRQKSRKLDG